MAFFTIKDYITIGAVNGVDKVEWQAAEDEDFNNIINSTTIDSGDLFNCHMELKKTDGSWYEEEDVIYVRVKIYSGESESPWFIVDPDKSHLITIWINDNLKDDIVDITKHTVGIIETDKAGDIVTEFEDFDSDAVEEKKFRREEYRKDY